MKDLPDSLRKLAESDLPPTQKCYIFLKKGILLGYYSKGQHLVEQELVTILHISRSPVREAIRLLESEKLIAHFPNKGCMVVGLSSQDFVEMYELREVLEDMLLRKLLEQGNMDAVRELKEHIIREYEERQMAPDRPRGDINHNFHIRLLALVNHRWLERLLGQMTEYIEDFHVLSFLRQGRETEAFHEHIDILDNLLAGNLEKAQESSRRHIAASRAAFLAAPPLW